jgi:hypothetical protein
VIPLLISLAPRRLELGERHEQGVGHVDAAGIDDHHPLERREAVPDGEDLVDLLLVLGDQHLGPRVLQQVLDLGRRGGRVDADRDRPDALDPQVGQDPGRAVEAVDRHPVAGLDAERPQAEADRGGPVGVVGPRVLLPEPEVLLAHGDAVRHVLGPPQQHGRQCGAGQRAGVDRGGVGADRRRHHEPPR